MPNIHITAKNSQIGIAGISADGGGKFILDKGASLETTGGLALLLGNGSWNIFINGYLAAYANSALSTAGSMVNVGRSGEVFGEDFGLYLTGSSLSNFGTINGGLIGVNMTVFTGHTSTITNHGLIHGGQSPVSFDGSGTLNLINKGTIIGPDLIEIGNFLDHGITHVSNSGKLLGNMTLGDVADTVTNYIKSGHLLKSGKISGIVDLGYGSDTFNGGLNRETVRDGPGDDTYNFGGGNDVYLAVKTAGSDGLDTVIGGTGIDTYSASDATSAVHLNFDTVDHVISAETLTALSAKQTSDNSVDAVTSFENAIGGSGEDWLIGSKGANHLDGGGGNDTFEGLGGADILTGGAGADAFHYMTLSDSGVTTKTRDTITDFEQGQDVIGFNNLRDSLGDPIFTFIGTEHFHAAHNAEFRYSFTGNDTLVTLDADGNGKADLSILLKGHFDLTGDDFYLGA